MADKCKWFPCASFCLIYFAVSRLISDTCFLVFCRQVNMHKTNQSFGPAQIAVSEEEFGWFQRFLAMKDDLVGGNSAVYFFTSTQKPCKYLNNYFQAAWAEMGLPESPTFTDVRSAIATHVSCWSPLGLTLCMFVCLTFLNDLFLSSLNRRGTVAALKSIQKLHALCAMIRGRRTSFMSVTCFPSRHGSTGSCLRVW